MATDLTQEFCALRDTYIEKQFGRLNEMQRRAVFTTDGPLLILAGAGSGKTTVLVNRIANLIRFGAAHGSKQLPRPATEEDVKALRSAIMTGTAAPGWLDGMLRQNAVRSWNVMAITFTNKAAGELKERLRRMLGEEEGDEVFASTFHSACVRILRRWAEEIGYPRSFTIYDTDDAQRVMKAVYKDLNVDDKFFPIKSAINQMSRWKDQLVSPEQALANPAKDTKGALAARIYAAYEKRLKEAGAFDFDDLIYQTVQLLAEHPDVRDFYQTKYRYLLVDEYQDTSVAQFRLVSLLAGPVRATSAWWATMTRASTASAGATIENILNFEKRIPGRQDHPAGAELPLHLQHPERRQLRHPAQHGAQGQDPVDRQRRGRQGAGVHRRERAGRGDAHCGCHRPAPQGGRPSGRPRHPLPHERPVGPHRKLLHPRGHPPQASWAASASTTAKRSRTSTPICPSWPTPAMTCACAASSTSLPARSATPRWRSSQTLPPSRG